MENKSKKELLKTGIELYNLGSPENPDCEEYSKALSIFDSLSSRGFENEQIYNLRWHIYYLRKEFDKALNDLDSAIEIDSEDRMAFYNRGFVYQRLNKRNKALNDFHTSVLLAKKVDDEDLIDAIEHYIKEVRKR